MNYVRCEIDDCEYYDSGFCSSNSIDIEEVLTAAGFQRICTTYRECSEEQLKEREHDNNVDD